MSNEPGETAEGAVEEQMLEEPVEIGLRDLMATVLAGGLGMLAMVPSFVAAVEVGVTSVDSFSSFAELVMLGGSNLIAGAIVFGVVGVFVHPLLFAAVAGYLPGKQWSTRGIVFALVLSTGFLPGFYTGQTGVALVGYVVLALFGHVAYGVVLGAVYGHYQRADYAV